MTSEDYFKRKQIKRDAHRHKREHRGPDAFFKFIGLTAAWLIIYWNSKHKLERECIALHNREMEAKYGHLRANPGFTRLDNKLQNYDPQVVKLFWGRIIFVRWKKCKQKRVETGARLAAVAMLQQELGQEKFAQLFLKL